MHFKRHELKYYINDFQMEGLLTKLTAVMAFDKNSHPANGYRVRSLYFDSFDDECLYQKQSGFMNRKKIRLRTYGTDNNQLIKLEIKRKNGMQVRKDSATITRPVAEQLCQGNYDSLASHSNPVINEAYATFRSRAYAPKVIVEYTRLALTLPVSNIRVTFDTNLHSNINHLNLFSQVKDVMPVLLDGRQILEVKYDDFFPAYLRRLISGINAERMAISKYTLARRFHKVQKWEDN